MDLTNLAKLISELGVTAVVVGAVLFASWKLLNWGKAIVDNAMTQLERERDRSAEVYSKMSKAIDEHTAQAREFHVEVRNAHVYQREEHCKLIDGMSSVCSEIKICGENTQREHERIIENLDEQHKVLLRINGEKH